MSKEDSSQLGGDARPWLVERLSSRHQTIRRYCTHHVDASTQSDWFQGYRAVQTTARGCILPPLTQPTRLCEALSYPLAARFMNGSGGNKLCAKK
jgi:hypothetical protein